MDDPPNTGTIGITPENAQNHCRAVHKGCFEVRMGADGQPEFYHRQGRRIPAAPESRFRGNAFTLMAKTTAPA